MIREEKERTRPSSLSNYLIASVPWEMDALWAEMPVSKFGCQFFLLSASDWEVPEESLCDSSC